MWSSKPCTHVNNSLSFWKQRLVIRRFHAAVVVRRNRKSRVIEWWLWNLTLMRGQLSVTDRASGLSMESGVSIACKTLHTAKLEVQKGTRLKDETWREAQGIQTAAYSVRRDQSETVWVRTSTPRRTPVDPCGWGCVELAVSRGSFQHALTNMCSM